MTLHTRFETVGQFLFRFRSYLPLALFVGLSLLFWQSIPKDTGRSAYPWRAVAILVALLGAGLRCAIIGRIPTGTSGRNTKRQKASVLNTTGLYSIVRNPLYVGNAMMWIGTSLLFEDVWLTSLFAASLLVYYIFVVYAEEAFLTKQFGEQYESYASHTPAFLPHFSGWTPSARPFSWRMVLRREHDSFFSTVTGLVFVFHCMDFRAHENQFLLRREWAIPWLAIAVLWIGVKFLKKRTHVLQITEATH